VSRGVRHVVSVAGLLGLLGAAVITVAHATPLRASSCSRAAPLKSVFPKARTVGFNTRWRIDRTRTRPRSPAECVSWSTTYTNYRGAPDSQPLRPKQAFAEVRVTLFKSRRDALAALEEPAYGPTRTLPSRARIRTLVETPGVNGDASRKVGYVASVVGNTFISSTGQGRPPGYGGNEAVRAQTGIHRRIHTAVLGSG
jgi:hypothetical protein